MGRAQGHKQATLAGFDAVLGFRRGLTAVERDRLAVFRERPRRDNAWWYRGAVSYNRAPGSPGGYLATTPETAALEYVWAGQENLRDDPEATGHFIQRRPIDDWECLEDLAPEQRDDGKRYWYRGCVSYNGGASRPNGYITSTRETAAVKHVWSDHEELRDDPHADTHWIERRPIDNWQTVPDEPELSGQ